MRETKLMHRELRKIADAAQYNLSEVGTSCKITDPSGCFMPLVIERLSKHQLSVAHYYEHAAHNCAGAGELIADPDVEFYVSIDPDGTEHLYPYAITHAPPFPYINTTLFKEGFENGPTHLAKRKQADLASFCSSWARNLRFQGFADKARDPQNVRIR